MLSSVPVAGPLLDRATQRWVRATGRRVDLTEHRWLDGPWSEPGEDGAWLHRELERSGRRTHSDGPAGLLRSMKLLHGPGFNPVELRPEIADFYENTGRWRLEAWSQWAVAAWPFGWLLTALFARRLGQLALPLRPLDVSRGIDSRVVSVSDDDGQILGAAWLRTLRATGETIYGGWYGTLTLPGHDQPSVRVVFPLPNGSVTVLLRPEVVDGDALRLVSPVTTFGDDGAYLVLRDRGAESAWVRRVPLAETFEVYVDDEGVLRADHDLRLRRTPIIRLHYRLQCEPIPGGGAGAAQVWFLP